MTDSSYEGMYIKRNSGKELIALSEKSHISSHLEHAPFSYHLFMPVIKRLPMLTLGIGN